MKRILLRADVTYVSTLLHFTIFLIQKSLMNEKPQVPFTIQLLRAPQHEEIRFNDDLLLHSKNQITKDEGFRDIENMCEILFKFDIIKVLFKNPCFSKSKSIQEPLSTIKGQRNFQTPFFNLLPTTTNYTLYHAPHLSTPQHENSI